MIDERFSANAFACLAVDSEEVERLLQELQAEIVAEVHTVAEVAFRRVVDRLRSLGHCLEPMPPLFESIPYIGECSFGPVADPPNRDWLIVAVETRGLALSGRSQAPIVDNGAVGPGAGGSADDVPF